LNRAAPADRDAISPWTAPAGRHLTAADQPGEGLDLVWFRLARHPDVRGEFRDGLRP